MHSISCECRRVTRGHFAYLFLVSSRVVPLPDYTKGRERGMASSARSTLRSSWMRRPCLPPEGADQAQSTRGKIP